MRSISFAALAASTMLALSPAAAATADADGFADGQDISNAFAGVSLLTVFTGADVGVPTGFGSVFAVTSPLATTGTKSFASTLGDPLWGNGNFEYLLATFTTPVTSVSLDFFSNDSTDDNPQLLAYDAMGAQIAIDSAGAVPLGTSVTLTVSSTGIKFVRAYWDEINRSNNGGLDNLVFNAVPEPASWAMMIAGFGLVGATMRRARPRLACA